MSILCVPTIKKCPRSIKEEKRRKEKEKEEK
jgi:hypothetical protein